MPGSVQDWSLQFPSNVICPSKYTSLKSTLQNATPKWKNEDVTWSPLYNLPTTRINKRRALSLQEVELHGWLLIFHIVLQTCSIFFMHKFNMSYVFPFYILRLTSWIWTNPSTERLKIWEPFKMNLIRGLQSWTPLPRLGCKLHFQLQSMSPTHWKFGL